ncbi:hypothetical protein WDW37_14670 [Bdellovibrionota bacterium FG-1]
MKKKNQNRIDVPYLFLAITLTLGMSLTYLGCSASKCDKDANGNFYLDCQTPDAKVKTSKCSDGTDQVTTEQCRTDGTPAPTQPGSGSGPGAGAGGITVGNGVGKNIDSANALIDPNAKQIQLANVPQGQKATEGGAGAPKPLAQTLPNVSSPDLTGRARNSAPNAGGGGSDSGQGFGLSGLKTSPASDSEQNGGGPTPAASGGAEAASAYKSGGGAGSAEGGNAGGPLGYGAGAGVGGAEGGSGNTTIEVGKDNRPLADNPTAGTSDPEDYFTRHGLKDNLFKIVERKYRETTIHWVQVDLQTPSKSAPLQ